MALCGPPWALSPPSEPSGSLDYLAGGVDVDLCALPERVALPLAVRVGDPSIAGLLEAVLERRVLPAAARIDGSDQLHRRRCTLLELVLLGQAVLGATLCHTPSICIVLWSALPPQVLLCDLHAMCGVR